MTNLQTSDRRQFLKTAGMVSAATAAGVSMWGESLALAQDEKKAQRTRPWFKISLAEWSLNKSLFGRKGFEKMDHLDFAKRAKEEFKINAVEYVNQFFKDKANDKTYLTVMKT